MSGLTKVGPDLDPNYLTLMVFPIFFFENVDFEKNQQTTKRQAKLPSRQRIKNLKKQVISFILSSEFNAYQYE